MNLNPTIITFRTRTRWRDLTRVVHYVMYVTREEAWETRPSLRYYAPTCNATQIIGQSHPKCHANPVTCMTCLVLEAQGG